MSRRAETQRGFTVVELVVGAALAAALLLALGAVLVRGRSLTSENGTISDVDAELRSVLARIADEVRCASRLGEDTNASGAIDTGEDTNANGRLEADWQATASSIRFNRFGADGKYALPVTYALSGTKLRRTKMLTTAGKTEIVDVAKSVQAFTVTDTGGIVTLSMRVVRKSASGRTVDRTSSITVAPRN